MEAANYRAAPQGYDREYAVPDMVRQFVEYLYRHLRERNMREIHSMYRNSFAKLTERYFSSSPWPAVDLVAEFVDNDHVFCLLYQELYFRHMYALGQPPLQARIESYDNYCQLFKVILSDRVNMQLPNEWLWDMVDEFIYQFQSFCQFRGKLTVKSGEELALLKRNADVWDPEAVLSILNSLVDQSRIRELLQQEGGARKLLETDGFWDGGSNVLRMLGYFSLIGLCTVHVLLGQYTEALQALFPIHPFERKFLFTTKFTMCNITTFYYAAFAYLGLRRWMDAGRLYNYVLSFINRVKALHQRSREYDIILKKNEQMYRLLAIVVVQAPASSKFLDEAVSNQLKEKCGDLMVKMARGDMAVYDDAFSYACPKFVTAATPDYDGVPVVDTNQLGYRCQLKDFLALVEDQQNLPTLKQYLQLYSSISLSKLASLMGSSPSSLTRDLAILERHTKCITWSRGDPLEGSEQTSSDIEFHVSKDGQTNEDMVFVTDIKPPRKQSDFLVRHIMKFDEVVRDLTAPPSALPRPASQAAY